MVGRYRESLIRGDMPKEDYRGLTRDLNSLASEVKSEYPKMSEAMLNAAEACKAGERMPCLRAIEKVR